MNTRVGYVLGSTFHPSEIASVARAVELNGFCRIWSTEDYFCTGGMTGATAILGATDEIRVATGLVSVYSRHPGLLAMETATVASVHPGRFTLGLGVGGIGWLDQQGIKHPRPLSAVRATVSSVRALLQGETVSGEHGGFTFDDVHLEFPPSKVPPVHVGATGPKMTALAAEISDGLILSVFTSPEFVHIQRGILRANGGSDVPITTFAFLQLADTVEEARSRIRPLLGAALADGENAAMTDALGITEDLKALVAAGGPQGLAQEMPSEWVDQLAVCGDADTCAERIRALLDAGSDEVALAPVDSGRSLPAGIEQLALALR